MQHMKGKFAFKIGSKMILTEKVAWMSGTVQHLFLNQSKSEICVWYTTVSLVICILYEHKMKALSKWS